MKVFVIFYEPGYGDHPYVKGVLTSREHALEAMKSDTIFKHDKENVDFQLQEFELNQLD